MATSIDDRYIINAALRKIGAEPLDSLEAETIKADTAVTLYRVLRDDLLGRYDWDFNKRTARLDAIAPTPENGYDPQAYWGVGYRHAFLMPGDRLDGPRKILSSPIMPHTPVRDFLVEQDRVYADYEKLWGVFSVDAAPDLWSPSFRAAIIALLAAEYAVPIAHDETMAQTYRVEGEGRTDLNGLGGKVAIAIRADAKRAPTAAPMLALDPLTSAHLS